jgi:hypothetical protein
LPAEAVADFLGRPRSGALCFVDASGCLRAAPVELSSLQGGEIRLGAAGPVLLSGAARPGDPACVVADEFESYEGIQGVIVQGELRPDGEDGRDPGRAPLGRVVLAVTRTIGFTFAGTLPPQLVEPTVGEVG